MANFEPGSYDRRILLVVSGMSPQILTETLYALTQKRNPAFIPTEVHVLTTSSGASNARLNLLVGKHAHFLRFCEDYGLNKSIFTEKNIHCIEDSQNNQLEDIRSLKDNEAAADHITRFIRDLTADDKSALHVSMAGGRKTMGYYAGYALSLYGREQDRLSHVLVTEGFEGHRDFYYPTRESQPIHREGKPTLDARDADVVLAEIPFVRLRQEIPQNLLDGQASFSESIAMAQRAQEPQRLMIDLQNLVFRIGEVSLAPIGGKDLALFIWTLKRQYIDALPSVSGQDLLDYNKSLGTEFRNLCEQLQQRDESLKRQERPGVFPGISKVIEALEPYGLDRNSWDTRRSELNASLRKLLGKTLSEQFKLHNHGRRGDARYGYNIDEDLIDWIPFQ